MLRLGYGILDWQWRTQDLTKRGGWGPRENFEYLDVKWCILKHTYLGSNWRVTTCRNWSVLYKVTDKKKWHPDFKYWSHLWYFSKVRGFRKSMRLGCCLAYLSVMHVFVVQAHVLVDEHEKKTAESVLQHGYLVSRMRYHRTEATAWSSLS